MHCAFRRFRYSAYLKQDDNRLASVRFRLTCRDIL